MQFLKKNIWTLCLVAFAMVMTMAGDASAQSSVMQTASDKTLNVFKAVKQIIFIVGGFGLVGIAFGAIIGKIQWKWFAGLAVGLAILAAAGSIVNYATGESMSGFQDTFDNATN